jgi:hypothetical protein
MLANKLKALGVVVDAAIVAAKLTELGLSEADLTDQDIEGLAKNLGAAKLAIAATATPTTTTRGRKMGLTKAAQAKAAQGNGFATTVAAAQSTAKTVEDFAANLESLTIEYCSDRLGAVPHNIQSGVMAEVANSDPADFQPFADRLNQSIEQLDFLSMV